MTPSVTEHSWSKETLFRKAQLYIQQMETYAVDDWQFGFWSSLAIELLARASISHISPVLQADIKNWKNLVYALDESHRSRNFSPKTATTGEIFARLELLCDEFNEEISGFCRQHAERRNTELHSGELAFETISASGWLPKFYEACKVLLHSMDKELDDLISDPEHALEMIEEFKSSISTTVVRDIEAHKRVWESKDFPDKEEAIIQAQGWATRNKGHRVECPSCKSQALVQGTPKGNVATEIKGDEIVQRQAMLPSTFQCIACGLQISGLSKLTASGLGNTFSAKYTYTAAEYFNLYTEDELEEASMQELEFEPDFNEYYNE